MTLSAPWAIVSMWPGEKKYGWLIFEVDNFSLKIFNEHRSNLIVEIPTNLAESLVEDIIIAIDTLDDWSEESS